jgi:hypothetical protein
VGIEPVFIIAVERRRGVVSGAVLDRLTATPRSMVRSVQLTSRTERGEISTFWPGHQFRVSTTR